MIRAALALALIPTLACTDLPNPAPEASSALADEPLDARARCSPQTDDEARLYSGDLRWNQSLEEMAELYETIYASGKRLSARAYYDPAQERFLLPLDPDWGGDVVLSERLIDSVRDHLELALQREYADFAFFSDMGHSHLFIPEARWSERYEPLGSHERATFYTQIFDDPELRVLYHTAEQLRQLDDDGNLLADRYLQWRYFTRNVVGDNRGGRTIEIAKDLTEKANTVRDLEGHHFFGAGFNVSASKDGCFPFTVAGQTAYFDLSLSDLEPDPNGPVDPL